MKFGLRSWFFSMLFVLVSQVDLAYAQAEYELSGGSSSSLMMSTEPGSKVVFNASAGLAFRVSDRWQFGAAGGASLLESAKYYSLSVGPTYNFGSGALSESFYASAMLGAAHADDYFYSDRAIYRASFGRRLELVENVSWKPEIAISGAFRTESQPVVSLIPFQLSIMF